MLQTGIPVAIGFGLAAAGAFVVWNERVTGSAFVALYSGLAILAVTAWRWLERDRDRLLRWSDERRAVAFRLVREPETTASVGAAAAGRRQNPDPPTVPGRAKDRGTGRRRPAHGRCSEASPSGWWTRTSDRAPSLVRPCLVRRRCKTTLTHRRDRGGPGHGRKTADDYRNAR
jgi:hypothetical protein